MKQSQQTGRSGPDFDALLRRGALLRQQGKLDEAGQCLRQALRHRPDVAGAHQKLADVLLEQGKLAEAAEHFAVATRLDPNAAEAHFHLGNILRAAGRWSEAATSYREVIRLLPTFPLAHYNLGTAFVANNQPEQARDCFQQALSLQPSLAPAHAALGDLLLEQGRRDEASAHYRQALGHDPACVPALTAVTWHGLVPLTEAQRSRMLTLLADPDLPPQDRARLHFGLANEKDRAGAYDDAFAHFRQANTLRRQVLREAGKVFDPTWYHAWIDQIIRSCDAAYFMDLAGIGRSTERPIFIVGMPRSGTSLVEQILASHPTVFGGGERREIGLLVAGLQSQANTSDYPDLRRLDATTLGGLADWYLQSLERSSKAALRVTDKTPNNFQFLGLIAALFPRARVIHCRRDARDVCLSCYMQDFKEWTLNLEELASYYTEYERLMAHWRSVLQLPVMEVAYEEVVENLEAASRRLVAFCGLDWDDRCLNFQGNSRAVRTASVAQVRQPIYKSSIGRWRHYEAYLGPLLAGLRHSGGTDIPVRGQDGQECPSHKTPHRATTKENEADSLNCRGMQLQAQGKLNEAASCFRKAVRLRPDFASAQNSLGGVCLQQGKLSEAALCFRKAIRQAPELTEAHFNLGKVLQAQGQWAEAAACFRQVIRLQPDIALAHYNLGESLVADAAPHEARDCFLQALRLQPNLTQARTSLADLLLQEGDRQEAVSQLREALRCDPACAAAWATVVLHDLWPLSDGEQSQMQTLLGDARLSPHDTARLHFGLGNVKDRAEAYDEAFAHYAQANTLRKRLARQAGKNFDAAAHRRLVERMIKTCDAAYFRRIAPMGRQTERPVFVVGMPRSGTSLVEQILASHPEIHGAGELKDIGRLSRVLSSRPGAGEYPECLAGLDRGTAENLAGDYLARLHQLNGTKARVIDKLPGNFLHLGLIAALFPRARVIHCKRDPLDVCLSCYFQDFQALTFTFDLGDIGKAYVDYERLMAHWRSVLPMPMLEIDYEVLVNNLEGVSRRLLDFCGLEWNDACLAFDRNPRAVRTCSQLQVRQPIYHGSVGRWRHYAAHLAPLQAELARRKE
jgi:tetratricopeptide (TPR) repeat protein